jgi:ArsR family transcriptional regulator
MRDRLHSTECARFLKARADPVRLKIVQCLQRDPNNVGQLSSLLGQELANVSHHLGVLRHAGLVQDERHGKYVVYSLQPDVFRPGEQGKATDVLDLGCCRLELNGR